MIIQRIRYFIAHEGKQYEVLYVPGRATTYIFFENEEKFAVEFVADDANTALLVLRAYFLAINRVQPTEKKETE